ncbi:MAG: ribulose-phosphate 3-epimerase [Acidobacteriota bacterium]|nr:ribulose-phosphate 3-epimerase [Acidobacteriota bacterium]
MTLRIAPSILSADFAALGEAVKAVEAGGADLIHVDVMDGHFVPNLTIGAPVAKALHRVARVPLDVHLMITDPDRYVDAFADAGAAMLSVHVETTPHLHRTLRHIKDRGVEAGAVLNPSTPVSVLEDVACELDFALVMSVNPGVGGQTFIEGSDGKVTRLRRLLDAAGSRAPIEIDGGVDCDNAARLVQAGADILVAGAAVFRTSDPTTAVRALRAAATPAAHPSTASTD